MKNEENQYVKDCVVECKTLVSQVKFFDSRDRQKEQWRPSASSSFFVVYRHEKQTDICLAGFVCTY